MNLLNALAQSGRPTLDCLSFLRLTYASGLCSPSDVLHMSRLPDKLRYAFTRFWHMDTDSTLYEGLIPSPLMIIVDHAVPYGNPEAQVLGLEKSQLGDAINMLLMQPGPDNKPVGFRDIWNKVAVEKGISKVVVPNVYIRAIGSDMEKCLLEARVCCPKAIVVLTDREDITEDNLVVDAQVAVVRGNKPTRYAELLVVEALKDAR